MATVWTYWAASNALTSATTTDGSWVRWCNETSSTTITSPNYGDSVWVTWNSGAALVSQQQTLTVPQLTKEQKADIEQRRIEGLQRARIENEKREKARREAQERAELLLVQCLNKKQKEAYEKDKCIPVDGASGKKYRIRKGWVSNIDVLKEDGTVDHRLCVHPCESVPEEDNMLAQKLFLEHDEQTLLALANRH